MTEQRRLAAELRELIAASRLTRAQRETLAELANDVELIDSDADELDAMVISLHEQAHGLTAIRFCTERPCRDSNLEHARGPAQWALL